MPLPIRAIKREIGEKSSDEIPAQRVRMNNSPPSKAIPILTMSPPSNSQSPPSKLRKVVLNPGQRAKQTKTPQKPAGRINVATPKATSSPVKILNKTNVKILNKLAPGNTGHPVLRKPVITTDELGNVGLVTEILENIETEVDPTKNADPVQTNVFPCNHCDRSFPLRQLLDIHMNNHNRERCFECDVCSKKFFSKYDLGKHTLIHTGDKPYTCVVCGKAFSRSTLLFRHEKIHTDQPKYLCVYCERPFLSKHELDKHTERHKKNRPFPCNVCGKSFAFKQGLERHEVIHSKEQPYKCEHCNVGFSTPSKLARHLTAHAGRRPYPCRQCPKSYLLSHHLTRHARSHKDGGDASYRCSDCSKLFNTRDDLIYHSAVHATQNLVCPLCKERFEDLDEVTEHIKSHTENEQFACEFCDLIFITEEKLQAHSNEDHEIENAAYLDDDRTRVNVSSEADSNIDSRELDSGDEIIEEFIIEEIAEVSPPAKAKCSPRILNFNTKTVVVKADEFFNIQQSEFIFEENNEQVEEGEPDEILGDESSAPSLPQPLLPSSPPPPPLPPTAVAAAQPLKRTSPRGINVFKGNPNINKSPKKASPTKHIPAAQQKLEQQLQAALKNSSPPSEPVNKVVTLQKVNVNKAPVRSAVKKLVSTPSTQNNATPTIEPRKPTTITTTTTAPVAVEASTSSGGRASTATTPSTKPKHEVMRMMIGDEVVKVQKVKMTKSQVAAMAKQGKIEVKGGQVFLKQKTKEE